MKAYLTFFSLFLLFLYVSLVFYSWCRVSPTVNFSFFLSFFLGISLNRFLFSGFFRGQSTNKIVTRFLSFFWRPFNLPVWTCLGKTVYSLHHRQAHLLRDLSANWLIRFFSSLHIWPSSCLISRGLLGQSAFSLQKGRFLLGAACQFIHPCEGNLTVNRPARTLDPNSTLQTSRLLLLICEGNKKRERERERKKKGKRERERESLFMSKIWVQGPNLWELMDISFHTHTHTHTYIYIYIYI